MDILWTVVNINTQKPGIKNPRKLLTYEDLKLDAGVRFELTTFRL
jgi:hypothetical protein